MAGQWPSWLRVVTPGRYRNMETGVVISVVSASAPYQVIAYRHGKEQKLLSTMPLRKFLEFYEPDNHTVGPK